MRVAYAHLLALSAISSLAIPTTKTGQQISIPVKYNANFRPDGQVALAKSYLKHGLPLSDHFLGKLKKSRKKHDKYPDHGSVTAHPSPNIDREYLSEVSIGTPPQKLSLDFDTGSSDLWVFSTELPDDEVNGQNLFNALKSSTAKLLKDQLWRIEYGDHSGSSGHVYSDVVSIGGLSVKNQAVETAFWVSRSFTVDSANSGLVGLGFDSKNTVEPNKQKTWFSNIKASLKEPIFTTRLRHQADGTYNFGYIDDTQYTGNITYTDVDNSQGFWGFTSTGYSVGDGVFTKTKISGIADTGTSLLLLPRNIVTDYYSNIKDAKIAFDNDNEEIGYVFPCNQLAPAFSFGIENSTITVPSDLMNYSTQDGYPGFCLGALQDGGDNVIFGDIALKVAFVVWDDGNQRLGWAKGV